MIQSEITIPDMESLNKNMKANKENILFINIRSLDANFNKLQIFIERLEIKPCIIICVESWNLDYSNYFVLQGYKMFYNNSRINKSDGVVVYIEDSIEENTEIIEIGKLKILNSCNKNRQYEVIRNIIHIPISRSSKI